MNETSKQNEKIFDTSHKYAIVSGWLIIPAIATLLTFIGALIMIIFVNPFKLTSFDLYIYLMDLVHIPFLLLIYYFWWKRKRLLPKLLIAFYIIDAIWTLTFYITGIGINYFNIIMNIVWILYFLKSARVKQTFIK